MPNYSNKRTTEGTSAYSYSKLLAVVRHGGDIQSPFSRMNRVDMSLKDSQSYRSALESMDDDTFENSAGCDISALFMPFQSKGGVSGCMPGFNRIVVPKDYQEINFHRLLPFQWESGVNTTLTDRYIAPSGDSLQSLISSDRYYGDVDRIRDLDYTRGIGLRGPVMLVGWGHTKDGDPWPSGAAPETGSYPSGAKFFKGGLLEGWQLDPSDYVAAPIDFRYDPERDVWTTFGLEIYRMRITGTIINGVPSIGICKKFNSDGITLKDQEIPVALVAGHKVGDEIYATKPNGGVIGNPTYNAEPLEWQEIARLPTGQYQFMHYQMVSQLIGGWDLPRGHPIMEEVLS